MNKLKTPYLSDDNKLYEITNTFVEIMRDAELRPDEVINILLNLLARSSILACIDRDTIVTGLAQTYNMHLAQDTKDETFN